jgi:hypothetical protein
MKNIHVITVTNSVEHKNVHFLKKSLKPYNLIVLQSYDPKIGNLSKIYKVHDYLINSNISDNDVICIVDAHDVVFNNKAGCINDVLSTFNRYDTNIIFSSENTCVHHSDNSKKYFESVYGSNYLNSGISVSIKCEYLNMLKAIIKNIDFYNKDNRSSDQRVIGNFISHNTPKNIGLDINNIFSTTLNSKSHINFTNINSFFVHITYLSNPYQLSRYKKFQKFLGIYD